VTPLDVACATDLRYLPRTAAMLHSLIAGQRGSEVRVHLLHGPDVTGRSLAELRAMLEGSSTSLVAHEIDDGAIAGLPSWGRIPATMWYRILLPELLADVDRVLYVDVDVLICDSLAELWQLDLTDHYVAAVTNVPEQHMLGHARDLGLPGPDRYFNSGVLLFNLERMRRDGCSAGLLRTARERSKRLLWPDQDALNLVLGERRLELHPRWNVMNSLRLFPWSRELLDPEDITEALLHPGIVHFEGPRENKPWHILCDHPLGAAFLDHQRQTPWPRLRRDGVTPPNLLRLGMRRVSRGHRPTAVTA
jgi:lipopolysaccharide biosynthesis glycosyltransferase